MPSISPFCHPPPASPALRAKTTGAGKCKPLGGKCSLTAFWCVCDWSVNNEGVSLNHLSCWWNSWTPTPDTDQGGKRPCGTTGNLKLKWDSVELKLTVISQTDCESRRKSKSSKTTNKPGSTRVSKKFSTCKMFDFISRCSSVWN